MKLSVVLFLRFWFVFIISLSLLACSKSNDNAEQQFEMSQLESISAIWYNSSQYNATTVSQSRGVDTDRRSARGQRLTTFGGPHYFEQLNKGFFTLLMLEKMSGYSLYRSGQDSNDLDLGQLNNFGRYNPVFLDWVNGKVQSVLANSLLIKATQGYYNEYYQAGLRIYVDMYNQLQEDPSFNIILTNYTTYLESGGFFVLPNSLDVGSTEELEAATFWVRRFNDGTAEQVFSILETVLNTFDPDYI